MCITYFQHKSPIKMKQKLKSETSFTLYLTSLHLNQLLQIFYEAVSVRDCYRSSIFLQFYFDVALRQIKAVNLTFLIQCFSFGTKHPVVVAEALIDTEFTLPC